MQKHQEWIGNRNYEQHLQSLLRIKQQNRKKLVKSAIHTRTHRISQNHDSHDDAQLLHQNNQKINSPNAKKAIQISQKEKLLLYNNFLLGKRILQANPVINTKKHEIQYKKHLKVMQSKVLKSRQLAAFTQFRQTKLKQYTESTQRCTNFLRLPTTGRSRNILILKILTINLTHFRMNLQNISLKMRIEHKKTVQTSEIVHTSILPMYQFYFKYTNPKQETINNSILIEIYEIKGLQQRNIGTFSIDRQNVGGFKTCLTSELRKAGKNIGNVQYEVQVSKRKIIKQSI